MQVQPEQSHNAAFDTYRNQLSELIQQRPGARILELGGGRHPAYSLEDLPDTVSSYTVNDIDEGELALTPDSYDKACFDVTGDVSKFSGKYDVIFSKTLIEHVSNGKAMHRNILSLLKEGGVAFHMAPTLYASPFVINKLIPERLSRALVHAFFPNRRTEHPKFPAHYSWCYGNRGKMTKMLKGVGFSRVTIDTFYGHDYFRSIPGLRDISRVASAVAAARDWSRLGSFAHIKTYK